MEKFDFKPYAKIISREQLKFILPSYYLRDLKLKEGDPTDLFGVVVDIKFLDKLDSGKLYMEYLFGNSKSVQEISE